MENLVIGFSRAKGFKPFSFAIRAFERTDYSHTYIKFYSAKYDRWMIYQASKTMVNFMSEQGFLSKNQVLSEYSIKITEEQKTKLITFAIDMSGKPYSLKAILGLLIKQVFKIKLNCLFDGTNSYVCSELVARSLKDTLGWDITQDLDLITPKELHEIVEEQING